MKLNKHNIEALRLAMISLADAAHADYPQYHGHWDNAELAVARRNISTKGGPVAAQGELVLVSAAPVGDPVGGPRVYAQQRQIDCVVDQQDIRKIHSGEVAIGVGFPADDESPWAPTDMARPPRYVRVVAVVGEEREQHPLMQGRTVGELVATDPRPPVWIPCPCCVGTGRTSCRVAVPGSGGKQTTLLNLRCGHCRGLGRVDELAEGLKKDHQGA